MGTKTGISWTDHTFNPWWGCTRVSPGCENCYAERGSKRYGYDIWGVDKARRTFGEKHWNEPIRWNKDAMRERKRHLVFCASMADICDKDAPPGEIEKLWALIKQTPWLDWQLLTKRPERIPLILPGDWSWGYENVWWGVSIESPKYVYRWKELQNINARCKFVSYEPALELVMFDFFHPLPAWIIIGGESGINARTFDVEWARNVIRVGSIMGISIFMKQLGSRVRGNDFYVELKGNGSDIEKMTRDLRIREFPAYFYRALPTMGEKGGVGDDNRRVVSG